MSYNARPWVSTRAVSSVETHPWLRPMECPSARPPDWQRLMDFDVRCVEEQKRSRGIRNMRRGYAQIPERFHRRQRVYRLPRTEEAGRSRQNQSIQILKILPSTIRRSSSFGGSLDEGRFRAIDIEISGHLLILSRSKKRLGQNQARR